MHIRLVTWDDEPPIGGQGIYARELRASLEARDITVSALAGHGPHAMAYKRVSGRGHIDMTIALNRSPSILTEGRPDLVHLSGGPGGLQLVRRLGLPVVFTAHHTYRLAHRRTRPERALELIERLSYQRADRVAAVSPSTADSLIEMGIPPSKVVVISPGIRLPAPHLDPCEREAGRMLFVGRLEPEKGPLDALEAMRSVTAALPRSRGFLVGHGSLGARLETSVERGGDQRVKFLGRLTDAEVSREYHRAQVVLVPSSYEGLGMVALEAMAAGAAVVGYDVTGLHDTIGSHGSLVPRGDVSALAQATHRLLSDDSYREELVAKALDAVRRDRSWSRVGAEFAALYRDVLDTA